MPRHLLLKSKFLLIILIFLGSFVPIIFAQSANTTGCISTASPTPTPRVDFLITAPSVDGKFYSASKVCITDPSRAPFVSYKIPAYADLKATYYTQAKTSTSFTKVAIETNANANSTNTGSVTSTLAGGKDALFNISDNLEINSGFLPSSAHNTAVFFVDGNLNIHSNVVYGSNTYGLVFITSGDVTIDPSVTEIDAVIIFFGNIYTAGVNCTNNSVKTLQLVINGSLISLNPAKSIKFCRSNYTSSGTVNNNAQPAEKINQQAKYLVILKDIYSNTFQKWTEIQ